MKIIVDEGEGDPGDLVFDDDTIAIVTRHGRGWMVYTQDDNGGDTYEIGEATADEAREAAIEYLARSLMWEVEDE